MIEKPKRQVRYTIELTLDDLNRVIGTLFGWADIATDAINELIGKVATNNIRIDGLIDREDRPGNPKLTERLDIVERYLKEQSAPTEPPGDSFSIADPPRVVDDGTRLYEEQQESGCDHDWQYYHRPDEHYKKCRNCDKREDVVLEPLKQPPPKNEELAPSPVSCGHCGGRVESGEPYVEVRNWYHQGCELTQMEPKVVILDELLLQLRAENADLKESYKKLDECYTIMQKINSEIDPRDVVAENADLKAKLKRYEEMERRAIVARDKPTKNFLPTGEMNRILSALTDTEEES